MKDLKQRTEALTEQELALYLGCEIETPEGIARLFSINTNGAVIAEFGITGPDFQIVFAVDEVKLILRPLSHITKNELKESGEITAPGNNTPEDVIQEALLSVRNKGIKAFDFSELKPEQVFAFTAYLLSKGFDLFNWIEQGKAIQKATA